jgi:hypothetical protein
MEKARLLAAVAGMVVVAAAGGALAQTFDETTVSFSFADDNVLRDPGETRINSPSAYFGGKSATSLDRFEDSVYRRTQSRLVLGKSFDTGVLSPEGALRVRLTPDGSGVYKLTDDTSYLKLNYVPSKALKAALTLYPIDSDKFRLGYYYDISWGGSNTFPKNFRKDLVPGLKLSVDTSRFGAFAGVKTALIRSPSETILDNPGGNVNQYVERSYYAFLGGAKATLVEGLTVGVSGGYFDKGTNTSAAVLGKRIYSGGGGVYVAFHTGGEVGRRLDLRLYQENPEEYPLGDSDWYKTQFGLDLVLEANALVQTLEDPDNFGSTTNEWARAAYLGAAVRLDKLRMHLDTVYRDLPYIVYNVPGFVPYRALSDSADLSHGGTLDFLPDVLGGEISSVFSVDYYLQRLGLTPALSVGLLIPATFSTTDTGFTIEGPYASSQSLGLQKVVVRGSAAGDWDILPVGEHELPVFIGKLDLKYTLGKNFSAVGEVLYARDPNFAQVLIDDHGHARRRFDKPDILGVGVVTEMTF